MPDPTYAYGKLPATDINRARAFYADTFGIEPFASRNDHLYYDVNGARFMIFASSGRASGTHDQLGFVVDDIDAAVEQLSSRGVRLHQPAANEGPIMDFGPVRAAWLIDTEHNLINLISGTSPLWSP